MNRDDVIAMLATYQARPTDVTPESIDSLELVWLLHQFEQRNGVRLDLGDDDLIRMTTIDGAVEVLNHALAAERG